MATNKNRVQVFVDDSILEQLKAQSEAKSCSISSIVGSIIIEYFQGASTHDITKQLTEIQSKLDYLLQGTPEPTQSESLPEKKSDNSKCFGLNLWAWIQEDKVKAQTIFSSERRAKKYLDFMTLTGRWNGVVSEDKPGFPVGSMDKKKNILLTLVSITDRCTVEQAEKDLSRLSNYDLNRDPHNQV